MSSAPDDETGAAQSRHRSGEPRRPRWRRGHDEDHVAELDEADAAELLRRTSISDRPTESSRASAEPTPEATGPDETDTPADDNATRRVLADALEAGLADPTPPEKRGLLRRRHEEGPPPPDEPSTPVPQPAAVDDLEARVRVAEETADEYAVRLRRAQADLAAAEERSIALSQEIADRASEHAERIGALTAERDAAQEEARTLKGSSTALSDAEHAKLVQAVEAQQRLAEQLAAQQQLTEEAEHARAMAREAADRYAAQLEEVQAELDRAEERTRTLAQEAASRASEHSHRVHALVAEKEAAEERARALQGQDTETAHLQQALDQAVRLAEEARTARAAAEGRAAELEERLAAVQSELEAARNELQALRTQTTDIPAVDAEALHRTEAARVAAEERAGTFAARLQTAQAELDVARADLETVRADLARERARSAEVEERMGAAATATTEERDARIVALEARLAEAERSAGQAPVAHDPAEATGAQERSDAGLPGTTTDHELAARLAEAEERIRQLQDEGAERNQLHHDRVEQMLGDLEAAEAQVVELQRRLAEGEASPAETTAGAPGTSRATEPTWVPVAPDEDIEQVEPPALTPEPVEEAAAERPAAGGPTDGSPLPPTGEDLATSGAGFSTGSTTEALEPAADASPDEPAEPAARSTTDEDGATSGAGTSTGSTTGGHEPSTSEDELPVPAIEVDPAFEPVAEPTIAFKEPREVHSERLPEGEPGAVPDEDQAAAQEVPGDDATAAVDEMVPETIDPLTAPVWEVRQLEHEQWGQDRTEIAPETEPTDPTDMSDPTSAEVTEDEGTTDLDDVDPGTDTAAPPDGPDATEPSSEDSQEEAGAENAEDEPEHAYAALLRDLSPTVVSTSATTDDDPDADLVSDEPMETPENDPAPDPTPTPAAPTPGAARQRTPYHAKRGSGLGAPFAALIALACGAAVGWMAYAGHLLDNLPVAVALTVFAVLAIAFALIARSSSSEVHLDRGQLQLRFGDSHHTFYLTGTSTTLEMTGRPGDKDWSIQVLRRGREPVTIDAKDVDPVAFTEALRQWRPEL